MQLRDTSQGYSWVSIVFHWLTALSVIGLYLIAEFSEDFPGVSEKAMEALHISIGMSVFVILVARILWRLANVRPLLPPQNPLLQFLARWVPNLLLAGIALMVVSGPLMIWSNGKTIAVFEFINLASPMAKNHSLHEFWEEVHEFGANLLVIGVGLHVAGAIKHQLIDRDNTITKMLKASNR